MKTDENVLKQLKQQPMWKVVKARVPKLSKDGAEYQCCCPFHEDDTPSFKLYREGGIWLGHCFGCGVTYNAIQFIEKFDKITFGEAIKKAIAEFAWEAGKETVESTFTEVVEEKQKVTYTLADLAPWEVALAESVEAQKWLADRGIQWDAVDMHLGFVHDLSYISANHPWAKMGWIAFPTVDGETVTGIKFRSLMGKKTPDGKKSGILRAPDMATSLYNLGAITPFDDAFIVEGEPDTVVMMQAGYAAAGLPSDKYAMSGPERDVLLRANRIFLAGDMDQVGRDAMKKLWGELRDRVYMIEWPDGCKDANDTFLTVCKGDVEAFQALLEKLKSKALETPIPDYYDVRESLRNSDDTKPIDNPRRLHARDKNVDEMAITLPGNVVSMFATYTGSGKTSWILDMFELEEAINWGSVVLNYSAELSPEEFARLVAANLLEKDRLQLTYEDFKEAARILDRSEAKFYVGYNPELNRIGLVLDSIEWAIRRLGARVVVLDHLHFLCRGERDDIKAQSDAMQRIKNIARKYQVIFIVVGQSRKAQPGRKGPSAASDAKGSESFISDASTTYHLHRNLRTGIDLERPETWPFDILENITDIRLDKCRTKGPGKAVARQIFDGKFGKFKPYTIQQPQENTNVGI
jgi:CHC2 zinc finger/AAA domain